MAIPLSFDVTIEILQPTRDFKREGLIPRLLFGLAPRRDCSFHIATAGCDVILRVQSTRRIFNIANLLVAARLCSSNPHQIFIRRMGVTHCAIPSGARTFLPAPSLVLTTTCLGAGQPHSTCFISKELFLKNYTLTLSAFASFNSDICQLICPAILCARNIIYHHFLKARKQLHHLRE